jgi:hypothetical protein
LQDLESLLGAQRPGQRHEPPVGNQRFHDVHPPQRDATRPELASFIADEADEGGLFEYVPMS